MICLNVVLHPHHPPSGLYQLVCITVTMYHYAPVSNTKTASDLQPNSRAYTASEPRSVYFPVYH